MICDGKLSGIIDIDWIGLGDVLTFAALTRVALLNMDLDTKYCDYLWRSFSQMQHNTKRLYFTA